MSDEHLDDDVQDLLSQLSAEVDLEIEDEIDRPHVEVPDFVDHSKQEEALKPIPLEIKLDNDPINDTSSIPPLTVDIALKAQQIDQVTKSILDDCARDREQAQTIIDTLMNDMQQSVAKNGNVYVPLVEQLIKAVELKSGINTNAIKIAETNVKLIAATKSAGNININNTSTSSVNASLAEILSQPFSSSDY